MLLKSFKTSVALGIGFVLFAASPGHAVYLKYGDADYDLNVDFDDASAVLGILLNGTCGLANLAVTNDAAFNVADAMFIAQYARFARSSGDLVGDGQVPFTLQSNTGANQSGDASTTLPQPLSVLGTPRPITGLCNDPQLATLQAYFSFDASGGALLDNGSLLSTNFGDLAMDAFGLSQPLSLRLGPLGGAVVIWFRIGFLSANGAVLGGDFIKYAEWSRSPTCGDGSLDPGEKCDPGIDPCCGAECFDLYACNPNAFSLGLGGGARHFLNNPLPISLAGTTLSVSGEGINGVDGPPCDNSIGCEGNRGSFIFLPPNSRITAGLQITNAGIADANCLYLTYLDSWPNDPSFGNDSTDLAVCGGEPYEPLFNYNGMGFDADNDGTSDGWNIGAIAAGASSSVDVALRSSNFSHCIHFFELDDLPGGNHPGCVPTCGDGILADRSGEVCEPIDNGMGTNTHLGCEDVNGYGNGCGVSANCICDPADPCNACVPAPGFCGDGALDPGELCDPGSPLGDNCCDPATCQWAVYGALDPQGICSGAPECQYDVCDGSGGCVSFFMTDGIYCGNPASTECTDPDTCLAGVCRDNHRVAGYPCGGGVAEPTCDPDVCDGLGACQNAAPAPECTLCAENGGVVCSNGVCWSGCAGGATVSWVSARKGTSPGYIHDWNNGLTGGPGGPNDIFTILPNDPAAAIHGIDMVVFDIALSTPLGFAEVVNCNISGIPAATNCGLGDSVCLGWGEHPHITGGGLDTINQQALASGQPGIGTAVAPDEQDTATFAAISCGINSNPPTTQNVYVHMGFVGVPDQTVPAGTTDVAVTPYVYCSNGATEWCAGIHSGAPMDANRGVMVTWTNIYYDPAVFDLGLVGEIGQTTGRALGPYFPPANGEPAVPTGACTVVDNAPECVQIAPGVIRYLSDTHLCQGAIMAAAGSCILGASSAPPPGTVTAVDVASIDAAFNAFVSGYAGFPIRGIDSVNFATLPSTNVTGYVIWD